MHSCSHFDRNVFRVSGILYAFQFGMSLRLRKTVDHLRASLGVCSSDKDMLSLFFLSGPSVGKQHGLVIGIGLTSEGAGHKG